MPIKNIQNSKKSLVGGENQKNHGHFLFANGQKKARPGQNPDLALYN